MWKKIILCSLLLFPISTKAVGTSASSAILMDMDSQRILYSSNMNEQRSVASISKIMTALIACESGKLDNKVIVGSEITKAYGSGIYIKEGEELTLRDLLYGLMLRSGNDAALAVAHYVGGSVEKFVETMNTKASELGMKNTLFHNPSGLDEEDGNFSTAYDMALLTSYAMKNEEYRTIVGTKKYKLTTNKNTYLWHNKHKLVTGGYEFATGGKTGFTKIAKRTLVTTASKENLNLVVVTLNDGNDWEDHKSLFEYGFNNYHNYLIQAKGVVTPKEDYYRKDKLYIKNNLSYPLSDEETQALTLQYRLEKKRSYENGDQVGVVETYLGDQKVHEEPVYVEVMKIEKKKGFFQKLKDWFTHLW